MMRADPFYRAYEPTSIADEESGNVRYEIDDDNDTPKVFFLLSHTAARPMTPEPLIH